MRVVDPSLTEMVCGHMSIARLTSTMQLNQDQIRKVLSVQAGWPCVSKVNNGGAC